MNIGFWSCIILVIPFVIIGVLFAIFKEKATKFVSGFNSFSKEEQAIKTVCWCGKGARCNARIDPKGKIIRAGEQVMVGANESYIALCRKHFREGKTRPDWSEMSEEKKEVLKPDAGFGS